MRTRGEALLELLGLLSVLEDESVEEPLAADLELDLGVLGVLLDPSGYFVANNLVRFCLIWSIHQKCWFLH